MRAVATQSTHLLPMVTRSAPHKSLRVQKGHFRHQPALHRCPCTCVFTCWVLVQLCDLSPPPPGLSAPWRQLGCAPALGSARRACHSACIPSSCHVHLQNLAGHSWTKAANKFTHLRPEEFASTYLGGKPRPPAHACLGPALQSPTHTRRLARTLQVCEPRGHRLAACEAR